MKRIPPELFDLPHLRELDLKYNEITEIPPEITRLEELRTLNLRSNRRLDTLPAAFFTLSQLRQLNLSHTAVSALSPAIQQLHRLTLLSLGKTGLRTLPNALWSLGKLEALNLYSIGLAEVPHAILNLKHLTYLNLRGNRLTTIPSWLFDLPSLEHLVLVNNPIQIPPPEILNLAAIRKINDTVDIKALRNYFRQLEEQGESRNYEAKLLVLGEGGAGKTTLAKKLADPHYTPPPDGEKTTEGVEIIKWTFPLPSQTEPAPATAEDTFHVNVWDFGGQEIYHATHQFFLTTKSVYVVVADTRREDSNFYYWFKAQETFGGDSPLLLVKNKKRGSVPSPDEAALRERFPNLKSSLLVDLLSAADQEQWRRLVGDLQYNLMSLEYIGAPLPKNWVEVRRRIEGDERPTIDLPQYLRLCAESSIENEQDALQLGEYLHNIGVLLHFQDDPLLLDTVILEPTWCLDAVYRVLDNDGVKSNLGRFSRQNLRSLWHERVYAKKREELLRLMQRFQICYPLPDRPDSFIAPHLLSIERPAYEFEDGDSLLLRYYYPKLMPKGILSRAIVLLHHLIESQRLVWRTGVVLKRDFGRAEMLELTADSEIRIRVTGGHARDLLMEIVRAMDLIHSSYRSLVYRKLVPCPCASCRERSGRHFFDLDALLERLANEKFTIECANPPYRAVRIQPLIDRQFELASLQESVGYGGNIYAKQVFITRKGRQSVTNSSGQKIIRIGDGNEIAAPISIAGTIEDSFNIVSSGDFSSDVGETLRELIRSVAAVAAGVDQGDAERARGLAEDADSLIREVARESPRPKRIRLDLETIAETAESLGKIAAPVVKLVEKLGTLLLAGDS